MLTGRRWANVRNQYFQYLSEQCQHINPRGIALNENTVTLPLDAVYVSLRAEHKETHVFISASDSGRATENAAVFVSSETPSLRVPVETQPAERGAESINFGIGSQEAESIQRTERISRRVETVTRKMELYEVVQRERLAVLLGAPGAGKTTLTRFVTARFAEACRAGLPDVTDKHGNSYGDTRLPILLRVASYAEALEKNHNLSLRAFLSLPFHDTGIADGERAAFFEATLQQGKALVLLDGLDEVASGADRAHIARQIESFVSGLEAGCRVLVTSRIVGYREARLGSGFAEYQMLDMDDAQVQEFLNRWCVAVETFQTPGAGETENRRKGLEESTRLLSAIGRSEGVRKLATNPLLLTILALVHRNQKHLPERRVELYRMASDTLLREWRPAQTGMKHVEVTEAEAETLLLPLAYHMHNTVETGLLDREEARKLLCKFDAMPRGLSPKDPAVLERINGFLTRIQEHSGLLVMHSTGTVGFLHLTFQEYFAARYLVNDFDEAKTLLRLHRHKARWEEPLRLAIATQTGANAAKLIRSALWHKEGASANMGYEPSEYEDILRRDLLLTTRCLGDSASCESILAREIADELTAICLNRSDKGNYEPLRNRVLTALSRLASGEIGQEIQRQLLASLQDKDGNVRESAVKALGQLGQTTPEVIAALIAALTDEDEDVRVGASAMLGQLGQTTPDVTTALFNILQYKEETLRRMTIQALGRLGRASSDVIAAIIAALKDKDGCVRDSAANALGLLRQATPEIIAALLAVLTDEERFVRGGAIQALGQLGQASSDVIAAIIAALKDKDGSVRESAVKALGWLRNETPDAVTILLSVLKDKDNYLRSVAAGALGQLGQASPEIVAALLVSLKNRDWSTRSSAANALGLLRQATPEIIAALLAVLIDETGFVRESAVRALGQLGQTTPEVTAALLLALKDNDVLVRGSAADTLGQLEQASPEIIAALLVTLRDQFGYVQANAIKALGQLGQPTPEVTTALLIALKHESWSVRTSAANALEKLGQATSEIIANLMVSIKDTDAPVRDAAWEAVWTLTSDRSVGSGAASG